MPLHSVNTHISVANVLSLPGKMLEGRRAGRRQNSHAVSPSRNSEVYSSTFHGWLDTIPARGSEKRFEISSSPVSPAMTLVSAALRPVTGVEAFTVSIEMYG